MKMKIAFISTVFALVLGGCTMFQEVLEERTVPKIVDGVDKYCELPVEDRQAFRNSVNEGLEELGHSLEGLTCKGDVQ